MLVAEVVRHPALAEVEYRYLSLRVQPLRITVELRNPQMIVRNSIPFDSLLAWAVVDDALGDERLPDTDNGYLIPLPIQSIWEDAAGFPLWAATVLRPDDDVYQDRVYTHKRQQPGIYTGTRTGRWAPAATDARFRDRQQVQQTTVCRRWAADCIGDPDEIGRLLSAISHIGHERRIGFGAVRHWMIEPVESFSLVVGNRLSRSLPVDARSLTDGRSPVDPPDPLIGWTPPYWKSSLHRSGWPAGAPVEAVSDVE